MGTLVSKFDLEEFLPYQLAVLAERVSQKFATLYKARFGISVAEWRVVAHLSQSERVSVREIHERVAMDKPKISRAATRLEASGYLTKSENPEDGRLVSLALTEEGRTMMAELVPLAEAFERDVLRQLGQESVRFRNVVRLLLSATE